MEIRSVAHRRDKQRCVPHDRGEHPAFRVAMRARAGSGNLCGAGGSGTGPLLQGHGGPLACGGDYLELVDEPARAGEPETKTLGARVTVAQRHLEVGDAWTAVARDHDHAAP